MTEGITCYEQDETLCEDGMCLRCGCRLRNDLLSAQQRVPVVRVKELEWEDADEGMCTKWRACALGGHYELVALDGDGGGLAVNFYWGRPLSFWFIQGEPDEWGPTGPKMFPTLDAAKSAAQADYEQRIRSAIEIKSSDGGVEGHALQQANGLTSRVRLAGIKPGPSENFDSSLMEAVRKAKARVDTWSDAKKDYASRALASSDPASGRSQPSPDVSVDELARVIADEIGICVDDDKSGVWINCHPAARALLARYKIERLDRLASGRR